MHPAAILINNLGVIIGLRIYCLVFVAMKIQPSLAMPQ
jgi:hypothetical protein